MVKTWIGISSIKTNEWTVDLSLKSWWTMMTSAANPKCKAMKSTQCLCLGLFGRREMQGVFNNKAAPTTILLATIKREVNLWVAAGAKHLSFIMTGE
jgi:hypothetical protein